MIKGEKEFKKWKENKPLTRKDAMLAQCYICNGERESRVDCLGATSCPMYSYAPYGEKALQRPVKPLSTGKNRASNVEGLVRYREARNKQKL